MQNKFSSQELLVAEWIKRGEDDEQNVRSILLHRDGTPNAACLLSHQMAEKYLKAFLVLTKKWFPRIHPLDKLVELCEEIDISFRELNDTAADLNPFYTPARYPGDYPDFSWKDAEEASLLALRIKEFVLPRLETGREKQEKNGFGIIGILITVATIVLVGGGGLYVWEIQQQKAIEQIGIEKIKEGQTVLFGNEAGKLCGPQPPVICQVGFALGCRIADKQWGCYPVDNSADTSTWKTYRNEKHGFEVMYPIGFTLSAETENEIIFTHRLISGYQISIKKYNCENISIDRCSVQNIFDVSRESLDEVIENHEFVSEAQTIIVAGQKAKTFTWFTIGDGARLILVPHPTKKYLYDIGVSFGFDPGSGRNREDVALDTETVSMLINSFKFTK
ncbi:MAG: HEPN domain-containing protein [bacterium]|nr:HEPN domain-containing protein [bacterium]MDZ4299353.1 HEPN domain-containing protein [Candidatus Sungbacteria bacterium]